MVQHSSESSTVVTAYVFRKEIRASDTKRGNITSNGYLWTGNVCGGVTEGPGNS